jgi:hypothetical protein
MIMRLRRANQGSAPSVEKSVLTKTNWSQRKMMIKLFRLLFTPYVEDDYGAYHHSGVGYTGVVNDLFHRKHGRIIHNGVGYTGVYNE